MQRISFFLLLALFMMQCRAPHKASNSIYNEFPEELVHFVPYKNNPVFAATDGFIWTRYKDNPIYASGWVEDMCVIKSDSTYYILTQGKASSAHFPYATPL